MIWIDSRWYSGAQKLHRSELARRREGNGFLGTAAGAEGGGGDVWLSGLDGTLRGVVGGLVKVEEEVNWVEGGSGMGVKKLVVFG